MKKLVIVLLMLVSLKGVAQNFEGTIKWSVKAEFTDPKQKAQMEEAQKKMADPATQAQMKQMQEKMNDPQMKAMMESNPQMKAQMDAVMATMAGGNLSSLMPTGMIIKVKDKNTISKMEGGAMAFEFLHQKDKDVNYNIDRKNKTYSIIKPNTTKDDNEVKVTKTTETLKVLNYNCVKYIIESTDPKTNKKTTFFVWATPEIKDIDMSSLSDQSFGKGPQLFYKNIDGVPLKMELNIQGMNMKMQVTEIKKETLNASEFVIPADFKETAGMFR